MLIETINYVSEVVSGQLFSLASQRLSNSDTMRWASDGEKTNGGMCQDWNSKVYSEGSSSRL